MASGQGQSTRHSHDNDSATMKVNFMTFTKEKLGTPLEPYDTTASHDLLQSRDGTRPVTVQLLSAEKKAALMGKRDSPRGTPAYKI